MVRWNCTQWCNYSCSYCHQNHDRKQIYKGASGHWADNKPWWEWAEAFELRFGASKPTYHITGGETLLDKKNMKPLLQVLQKHAGLLDMDSNLTFEPRGWDLDFSKVELMVSYHPEHTDLAVFRERLRRAMSEGWPVKQVALVVWPDRMQELRDAAKVFWDLGLPVNVLPLDGENGSFPEELMRELKMLYIPPQDDYAVGKVPAGKPCLYPSLAYEIDPDGSLIVACHRSKDWAHGNLFHGELPPLKQGYTPCPKKSCSCVERYSFLQELGVNLTKSPKGLHAQRMKEFQGCE